MHGETGNLCMYSFETKGGCQYRDDYDNERMYDLFEIVILGMGE